MKTSALRQPITRETPDLTEERIAQLRDLFPEAFTEGKIDFDKLRALLGDLMDDGPERYTFSWAGKRDAIRMLQTPSAATLVPCEEESIDFEGTQNVFIEGENLEVLKLLYKAYAGRVKMIYIDPPYNTGNDFIYPDNYADPLDTYLQLTGQKDSEGNLLTTNPETSGRYHSAWLSMMYPRLVLARQLLRDDGVIFVSIDDHEVHNLRMLMNEVFGEENVIAEIVWKKAYGGGAKAKQVVGLHEYILCYGRNRDAVGEIELPPDPDTRRYYKFKDERYEVRGPYRTQPLWTNSMDPRPNLRFPILWGGHEIWPRRQWQWEEGRVKRALANGELVFVNKDAGWSVYYKQYLRDESGKERGAKPYSVLDGPYTQEGTAELDSLFGDGKVFSFPKPTPLVQQLASYCWGEKHAIVLDFFAGSCPTAQAILTLNRESGSDLRFIMVQLPEPTGRDDFATIADIGKERIRRVIARMKEDEQGEQMELPEPERGGNSQGTRSVPKDLGFRVFKLAPSNYRPWQGTEQATPEAYAGQMELFTDALVEGWNQHDVVWEVAIKEGYGLDSRIERLQALKGQVVYRVTDPDQGHSFLICLDDLVRLDELRPLDLEAETLFVCRDVALDDETAANLALQCRLKTI